MLIAGPTAGGKSALALDLAERFDGVVINADSMQVYRELRILTARPGRRDEARAPHRLFGTVAGSEPWSAGRWLEAATAEMAHAGRHGRTPILVGGTGLYFESLVNGLAAVPDVPDDVRDKWRAVLDRQGPAAVRDALAMLDPAMAARIPPSDPQRTLRAVEVIEATGRSLSDWQAAPAGPALGLDGILAVVVSPDRATLHARIDDRAAAMIEAGAVAEVEALLSLQLDPRSPVMKAIGVRELGSVIAGRADLDTALAAMRTATRRYAKRQLTWARGRMADWRWLDPGELDVDALLAEAG